MELVKALFWKKFESLKYNWEIKIFKVISRIFFVNKLKENFQELYSQVNPYINNKIIEIFIRINNREKFLLNLR